MRHPIVPFEYEDVICPEPSDEIKEKARKARGRGRQKNNNVNDTVYNTFPQQSNRRGRLRRVNDKSTTITVDQNKQNCADDGQHNGNDELSPQEPNKRES